MRALLARGARQELQNIFGESALHSAAYYGYDGVAALLCAAPGAAAALALRDTWGRTPLGCAMVDNHAAAKAVLRAAGARK